MVYKIPKQFEYICHVYSFMTTVRFQNTIKENMLNGYSFFQ